MTDFDKFFQSHLNTILWTSSDANIDSEKSLEALGYNINDFNEECIQKIRERCEKFFNENFEDIKNDIEHAGYDFYMTLNKCGVGFWDGDWQEPMATRLTDAAHKFNEDFFYVENGEIYCD